MKRKLREEKIIPVDKRTDFRVRKKREGRKSCYYVERLERLERPTVKSVLFIARPRGCATPHARASERVLSLSEHACGKPRPECIKRAPLFLPRQRLPGCKSNGGKNSADQLWLCYRYIIC